MFLISCLVGFLVVTVATTQSPNYCLNCIDYLALFTNNCKYNATIAEDILQITTRNGFTPTNISMTTDDGYKISMVEIKNPNVQTFTKNPTLFVHGMAANQRTFILDDLNSLAYRIAADSISYALNLRGNKGSLGHVTLDPNTFSYWNFTYEDARLDIQIALNTIIQRTGQAKVNIVCHSLGCASTLIALIFNEALRQIVGNLVIIAPSIYVAELKNIPFSSYVSGLTAQSIETIGLVTGGRIDLSTYVDRCIGANINLFMGSCRSFYIDNFGESDYIDYCRMIPVLSTALGAIPTNYMVHMFQNSRDESFNRFDYGPQGNQVKYGQATAPPYDLTPLTMNKKFIAFNNDQIVLINNIRKFVAQVPEPKTLVELPDTGRMSHIDCMKSTGLDMIYNEVASGLAS